MPNYFNHWVQEVFGSPTFASGMLGTLVGGAITMAIQKISISENRRQKECDKKDAQLAYCSAFLFKTFQICTNIGRGLEVFERYFTNAKLRGLPENEPWAFCLQVVNPGSDIRFEANELSAFLQLHEIEVFNQIASLDNLNNTFLQLIKVYNEKRTTLAARLKAKDFDAQSGSSSGEMPYEEFVKYQPYMFECNDLIAQIVNFRKDLLLAKSASNAVVEMISRRFGTTIKVDWEL